MCVAAVIETNPPTHDELAHMESDNPHGGGVAWLSGNAIHFRKGLSAIAIASIAHDLPTPWLLHFRWATAGSRAAYNAHPFPLGKSAFRRKLQGSAEAVLIHNGTWTDYQRHVPPSHRRADVSDTAVAAYVAGMRGEEILDDVSWATAVLRARGDRVDVVMRGRWYEHHGNQYSNLHWQRSYGGKSGPYRVPAEEYPAKRAAYEKPWGSRDESDSAKECADCGALWWYYHECPVTRRRQLA